MFVEFPRGPEPDAAVIEALRRVSPSTLGHMRDDGFLAGLAPLQRPVRLVGPAVTVRIPHLDSTAVHCALDVVRPGDVVVVDQSGDREHACWGGGVSYAAKARGVAGAVVEGAITDVEEIAELSFPVFHRTVSARTTRLLGIEGAINVPVQVAGAVVSPGDIVFADENGVAVLRPDEAAELVEKIAAKEAWEVEVKLRLDAGDSLAELSGARKLFDAGRVDALARRS
jgi:regulator of RNase E activity RraA